jgi:chromosome segregation ATPase
MRKTVENSSQSVITNILKNVQNLEDEFRNVKEMIDELKAQNTERDLHKLDIFGQENEQIQNQVNVETEGDTESGALEQLKTERDLLRKQVEELERQTEEHKITIAKLNKEMLDKENISKIIAAKSESMQREFENARMLLQKENEEIKLELERLKKKSAYEGNDEINKKCILMYC